MRFDDHQVTAVGHFVPPAGGVEHGSGKAAAEVSYQVAAPRVFAIACSWSRPRRHGDGLPHGGREGQACRIAMQLTMRRMTATGVGTIALSTCGHYGNLHNSHTCRTVNISNGRETFWAPSDYSWRARCALRAVKLDAGQPSGGFRDRRAPAAELAVIGRQSPRASPRSGSPMAASLSPVDRPRR